MVPVEGCVLDLPHPSSSSFSPSISALQFESNSLSLAIMHPDSSFSLYSSVFPFSPSRPKFSIPTVIPPPISSSSFFLLSSCPNSKHNPNFRPLFVVVRPHDAGAKIIFQFYVLNQTSKSFAKARVVCSQKSLRFDEFFVGAVLDAVHGVGIKVVGSVNVFAMYSVWNSKIWVFAAKMVEAEDGGVVRLMKCSVIECTVPVWSMSISYGYLMLGEDSGVRVFLLRRLVEGKVKARSGERKSMIDRMENAKLEGRGLHLPNEWIKNVDEGDDVSSDLGNYTKHKAAINRRGVKLKCLKLRQGSSTCFVEFTSKDESSKATTMPIISVKATSIQAVSPHKFLILDSLGNLYLMHLPNLVLGSKVTPHLKQLNNVMKTQMLAVLPDNSARQIIWLSDGSHSVHMMDVSDMDISINENDRRYNEDIQLQISVNQAIFCSEKIQNMVPFAANAILILGQEKIFAYAIS